MVGDLLRYLNDPDLRCRLESRESEYIGSVIVLNDSRFSDTQRIDGRISDHIEAWVASHRPLILSDLKAKRMSYFVGTPSLDTNL